VTGMIEWGQKSKPKKSLGLEVWPQGRGYSGFLVTGMIEWGHKSKPKKIARASNKTQENPWIKN